MAGDGPAVVFVEPDAGGGIRSLPEKEDNDSPQNAQAIEVDSWYQGATSIRADGKIDLDYFKINVTADSQVLSVTLSGAVGVDLTLTALSSLAPTSTGKGQQQVKEIVTIDNNGAGGGETLANLRLNKGAYLLLVNQRVRKGATAGKGTYLLQARLRPLEDGEEVEPNGARTTANTLVMGEEAIGYLGWSGDSDWYRVVLNGDGDTESGSIAVEGARLRVAFEGVDGVRAYVSLRTERGHRIQSRWGGPGEPIVLSNVVLPKGAKAFFVLVGSRRSFNVESRYSLTVSLKAGLKNVEEENNDSAARANTLEPGQQRWGMIPHRGDRDYYRVVLPTASFAKVTARAPAGLDLRLNTLDAAGKVLWQMDANTIGGREQFPVVFLPAARPLLVVRAAHKGRVDSTASYSLKVELMPGMNWEMEPNDTPEQATVWPKTTARVQGFSYPAGDVDVFRFVAVSKQLSMVIVPPGAQEMNAVLLDESGGIVARAKPQDGRQSLGISATVGVGQSYLVKISAGQGAFNLETPYSLEVVPSSDHVQP